MNNQPNQTRPIRIMQFWGGVPFSPNSKWRQTLRLVEKCSAQSWQSTIVLSKTPHSRDLLDPFLQAGAEVLIHERPPSSLQFSPILKTYQFLHRHPCELIHCHNRPVVPLLAATLQQVPVRIWSRLAMSSSYENNIPPAGLHKLQLNLRLSCLSSDKILCIAKPVLDELTTLGHNIKEKAVVVGGAIDLNFYSSGCPINIRKEFSLAKDNLVLISVGHAVPVKGWDILLLAYAKFQKIFPHSKLILVGSLDLAHEKETLKHLRQIIETFALHNNVILTGKRDDIPDILAVADIYIQSSRSEGLCGALIEALAAGLPCIASDVGGTTDAIQSEKNGLLFEREDINGLAAQMVILAQNPVLRKNMSRQALSSVQHFGLETISDTIMNIYQQALRDRGILEPVIPGN